jgi:hypothetical protein
MVMVRNREIESSISRTNRAKAAPGRGSSAFEETVTNSGALLITKPELGRAGLAHVIAMCLLEFEHLIIEFVKLLTNLARPRGVEPLTPRSVVWTHGFTLVVATFPKMTKSLANRPFQP